MRNGFADFGTWATARSIHNDLRGLKLKPVTNPPRMAYHDACKLGRHGGVLDELRAVLRALGVDYRETTPTRELNWC